MTRIPTPSLRGVFALLFAVGIVTAAAGSGMFAGTGLNDTLDDASPVSDAEACGGLCVGTALVIGSLALGAVAGSQLDDDGISRETLQKIKSAETLQQKTDLHALADSSNQSAVEYRTQLSNSLLNSRSIASMEAKRAALKLLNNGTKNATKVRNAMHEAIEDYYAVYQHNLITKFSSHSAQIGYILEAAHNDSGISNTFVDPASFYTDVPGGAGVSGEQSENFYGVGNTTVELVNGESVNETVIQWHLHAEAYYDGGSNGYADAIVNVGFGSNASINPQITADGTNTYSTIRLENPFMVQAVSGSDEASQYPESVALDARAYNQSMADILGQIDQMEANYNLSFAQELVAGYKAGTLNASDIVTPEMLARDFSTSYNETGASIYQWASLASMGLDSPDLANTSYMEVNYYKSTPVRYVTLTANGTPSAPTPYNISVGGEVVGQLFEDANDTSARVPIPVDVNNSKIGDQPPTVNIVTYGGLSTAWGSQEVDAGETLQVEGVNITASKPGRYKRVTEKGMLFARNAPNGTWEVGETYNASTIPGTEFFAPAGKYTRVTRMSGNFTIEQIVTDSGSTVTNLSTRDYNYQTSNASEYVSQLQSLEDVRKDAESREPTVGGGSGGGGNQSPYILVALFALGAALLYYNRGDTDG